MKEYFVDITLPALADMDDIYRSADLESWLGQRHEDTR